MVSKEVKFAGILEQVRQKAKEQGNCIAEEQVREAFAELELNDAQMQEVFDYLEKRKIGIGEPVDLDEYLTEEERDYLQQYLDEIALLPPYSDGERLDHVRHGRGRAGKAAADRKLPAGGDGYCQALHGAGSLSGGSDRGGKYGPGPGDRDALQG